jgi:hypothetical protein
VFAGKINASIKPFKDAKCLQLSTDQGTKHFETQTKLLESVSTAIVLGSIELIVMIGEVGNTVYEQYTKEESVSRMLAYIMMMLQVGQVVLAIVDFSVFTTSAYNDAAVLFGESIKDLETNASAIWCVSMTNTSLACLNKEKSDTATVVVTGRRMLSSAWATSMPPPTSSWPLLGAAETAIIIIGVAAVVIVVSQWARKRQV